MSFVIGTLSATTCCNGSFSKSVNDKICNSVCKDTSK